MADLKRWFKVWTSILDDPSHSDLTLDDVGRWARLGAMTALVGNRGQLAIEAPARRLLQLLEVEDLPSAIIAINRLPNVHAEVSKKGLVSGKKSVYDEKCVTYLVTWKNWHKYQVDSTVAQRVSVLRSKKRREEKRREVPPIAPHGGGTASESMPDSLGQAEIPQAARVQGPSVSPPGPVPQATTARKARRPEESDPAFEQFYAVYPRHEAKQPAWRAWKTLRVSSGLAEEIMAALARHRDRWQRLGTASDKIPLPASWLNGKRWMDQFDVPLDLYAKFPRGGAGV